MTRLALRVTALAALLLAPPALAQAGEEAGGSEVTTSSQSQRRVEIAPYIEAAQVVSWQLAPGDEVVTYTRLAAGVDAAVQGRNTGASVSVRYERDIGWGDAGDRDTVSGIARGYASVIPRVLTVEAGALASRTRVDGVGGPVGDPLIGGDLSTQTYSAYAGPTLTAQAGDVGINGFYRIGYTRVDLPDVVTAGTRLSGGFDESVTHRAGIRAGTQPGAPFPVGVGVGAGYYQEDISTLDQRVRDANLRGDVTVPVTRTLSLLGGVGVEDVEVSARDALRDAAGVPILDVRGRYITDPASPRRISFSAEGLIWDVGVLWQPSRRTTLEAHYGHRYDSETFYGSFAWQPTRRSNLSVSVYDAIQGFGGRINNALAELPTDFEVIRDPLTGEITGCVSGVDGTSCLAQLLGQVRSSVYRGRGVNAGYSHRIGQLTASLGAGYENRRFIADEDSVLAAANGVVDENWFANAQLSGPVGRRGQFALNAFGSRYDAGEGGIDVTALGVSGSYLQQLWERLSGRVAVSLTTFDGDFPFTDTTNASVLVGLRYSF